MGGKKETEEKECYVLSTLVRIFRCMSRSIVISSFLSSDQLHLIVTKCNVSPSAKCYFTSNYNIKAIARSATNSGDARLL